VTDNVNKHYLVPKTGALKIFKNNCNNIYVEKVPPIFHAEHIHRGEVRNEQCSVEPCVGREERMVVFL
jgi:hypothetical protein